MEPIEKEVARGTAEPNHLLQPLRPTIKSEPITRTGRTAERGVGRFLVKLNNSLFTGMKMLNIKSFFVLLAVILFFTVTGFAQQTISTEKRGLIQEFRDLTSAQNFSAKAEFSSAEVTDSFIALIEQDKELTDRQKEELKKSIAEAKERLDKEIRSYFEDKATMKQLSDEVAFQLYDKNFTEAELRELITFYRTPTGQKAVKFLSTVNAEMRKSFGEAFKQKLQEYAGLKVKAENDLLKQKIREAKEKKNEN